MSDSSYSGDYDVVVIGGALVGGVLALSFANSGKRVVLIDAQPITVPASADVSGAGAVRTTAVAAGSVAILDALTPQLSIAALGSPIQRVHVSQQGFFGATRIDAEEEGVRALGYVVENLTMQSALYAALAAQPLITRAAPVVVHDIQQSTTSVSVHTDHGLITAPWLVGVDGANSSVRKLCKISHTATDYEQSAVVSTVEAELPHQQTAYERFTPQGPMAMLPMGTHSLSLIFTVDKEEVEAVLRSSDDEFRDQVQRTFGYRLGRLTRTGARQAFPLRLQESDRQSAERVLLLGNAARSLHPVAGQGFNLAVRDMGALLALVDAAAFEQDIPAALSAFVAQRKTDHQSTVRLTDFFARSFRGHNPVLSHLRGLGLIGLDVLPVARRRFARRAMGLAVSLPDIRYPT
ncbi:MAG: FAD-dependent monooxygenase [Granulosicoccus sp.]|nr:FAD-dependent monooxygenase [Granulosicoccus sp.]